MKPRGGGFAVDVDVEALARGRLGVELVEPMKNFISGLSCRDMFKWVKGI